jgi:hypothetical protein
MQPENGVERTIDSHWLELVVCDAAPKPFERPESEPVQPKGAEENLEGIDHRN